MLNENLSATTIDDNKIKQTPAAEIFDRNEENVESIHPDIQEGQPQKTIDKAGKKKRKRENRRRRRNANKSDIVLEDDQTKSSDLPPSTLVEEPVVAEIVSLRDQKETGLSEIEESCDKCEGDAGQHSQTETASATAVSSRIIHEPRVANNVIESIEIQELGYGSVDQPSKTKRKNENRRRRRAAKTSGVVVEEHQMKSSDLPSSSLVEEPVLTKMVSLKDDKETGLSKIGESDNKYNGDEVQHSQTDTASTTTVSWRIKDEPRVANNVSESNETRKLGNGSIDQRSQTQPGIMISSIGEGKSKRKVVHMYLSTNKNIKLDRTNNAWVPTIAARQTTSVGDGTNAVDTGTNIESNTTEEINKKITSILNKITPENMDELIKSFMGLPINTIERVENAADLVFERAIREQNFAAVYAALCSAMQSVQLTCAQSTITKSFRLIIIKKCQTLFELDKSHHKSSMKIHEEINSCSDPEKKKDLQFEYRENERRLHKRSLANCCFIAQLFNQQMISPKIIQHCIAYLICQRSDDQIECLCNLLRTCGKRLERLYNLKETFSRLKALAEVKDLSTRIRFMIQALVELRSNNWTPRHINTVNGNKIENKNSSSDRANHPATVVANVVQPKSNACQQTLPLLKSNKSKNTLKKPERVEPDPAKMDNRIDSICSNTNKKKKAAK